MRNVYKELLKAQYNRGKKGGLFKSLPFGQCRMYTLLLVPELEIELEVLR
jgi:hypothetical protein